MYPICTPYARNVLILDMKIFDFVCHLYISHDMCRLQDSAVVPLVEIFLSIKTSSFESVKKRRIPHLKNGRFQ